MLRNAAPKPVIGPSHYEEPHNWVSVSSAESSNCIERCRRCNILADRTPWGVCYQIGFERIMSWMLPDEGQVRIMTSPSTKDRLPMLWRCTE